MRNDYCNTRNLYSDNSNSGMELHAQTTLLKITATTKYYTNFNVRNAESVSYVCQ